jgi:uncharacterized protein (TIGR03118 family)
MEMKTQFFVFNSPAVSTLTVLPRKSAMVITNTCFVICSMLGSLTSMRAGAQNAYLQRNLVSDLPGLAANTDTNLVNPWGIAFSSSSPFWISDNHSGLSTLYTGAGTPQSLVVNIPSPAGFSPLGAPTGVVFNNTTNFAVGSNAPAHFIFATEDGTIVGWNAGSNAVLMVDNSSSNAVYKGLAIGTISGVPYLFATDFHNGKVDIFDTNYNSVVISGAFSDTNIPAGFAPFGIQNIGGQIYVTYAVQDADKHDDVAGPGHGYVDVFTTTGQFVRQLVAAGALNSPWGLVVAPVGFGPFGGALLVGNFGDGVINAYDPADGNWFGALNDTNGVPVKIAGLWGIAFGNSGKGGDTQTLYFAAGIPGPGGNVEDHGLFGSLSALFPAITLGATYLQHNLVSDIAGLADHTDTNLVNPWGISFSASSPFWIADNHSGLSTLYNSSGTPQSLVVTIPPPNNGSPPAAPTGTIFNNTSGFAVGTNGTTRFIFSTEDGTISGWSGGGAAVLKVDNSAAGTVYKGLAAGSVAGSNYLYATDFHGGKVDVFDSSYNPAQLSGTFSDATLPAGFAPFGIQNIHGQIFVTYALQDGDKHDDLKGPGNGFVNVFDPSGHLLSRLASQGVLNSPWGIALAPQGFGAFAGDLLVGNFGDGRINAFDTNGTWMGTINDTNGNPFSVNGLWGVAFGNGGSGGDLHTLYFTAGLNGESDGLFGSLSPVQPAFLSASDEGLLANLKWAGGLGPFLLQKKADLSVSNWVDVLTTGNRATSVAKDSSSAVLRVAPQTSKTVLPFTVLLNGASQVPEVNTPGTGIGSLSLEGSNLTWNISFSGLSAPATMAHIHAAATATNTAGVALPFTVAPVTSGTISGTAGISTDLVADILNGMAYVNIHTANNPSGEIRGQIVPLHITTTLDGASEVPPVQTTASATASFTLVGSELFYSVTFAGLSGPATAAHIHGPADSTNNASPIIIFSPPSTNSGTFSGTASLTPEQVAYLLAGQLYINIHSVTNGTGEIRGQIYPVQFTANLNGPSEVPATTSPGSATGSFNVANSVLFYNFSFTNLLSAATGAHIHGPADTSHSAGVLIPFTPPPTASGSFSGSAIINSDELLDLISGLLYANIHTTNYIDGEIRGQLMPRN